MTSRLSLLSDEQMYDVAAFDLTDTMDLHDPRFGSAGSLSFECPTCGMYEDQCIGHHAVLDIGCYIFHPLMYKEIESIINTTCIYCGSAMSTKKARTWKCLECREPNHSDYKAPNPKKDTYAAARTDREGRMSYLFPKDVVNMLPVGYVISRILVPPVNLRTPEDIEWSSDIQKLYEQLVSVLRNHPGDYNATSRIYSEIVGSNGIIMKLISGKDGIFRKIMIGKRVESCARTVITPDPCIAVDNVAVPRAVVEEIRVRTRVTRYNLLKLKDLAAKKALWWCFDRDLVEALPRHVLVGTEFIRRLEDGDIALFNRQPSLSRSSLMCFRIVKRKDNYNTFGMNPQAVSPFNADFDGDEMNLFFMPESCAVEMLELCHVSKNVNIDGKTVLVPVQDLVTGCYLMSQIGHERLASIIPEYTKSLPIKKRDLIRIIKDHNKPLDFIQRLQDAVLDWLSTEGLTMPLGSVVASSVEYVQGMASDEFREKCHAKVLEELGNSPLMSIIQSGAKGSIVHASHMAVALGQIHTRKSGHNSDVCRNSYSSGLSPKEFFRHQMAAREGIVSTGVTTSSTGYLNRRVCKIVADLKTQYNGAVGDDYCISSFPK